MWADALNPAIDRTTWTSEAVVRLHSKPLFHVSYTSTEFYQVDPLPRPVTEHGKV